jgi:diguanylate cyclase (GGDEF)-like protein/PAS domain S-box-containing protein
MNSLPNRVLIADDEPTARLLMESALRKAGFAIELAVDGEDALRQFDAQPCDIVLLDVDMPRFDGYEVCAALRARVGNEMPIIMVTGMDDLASIERAYESGATDFISKPINWALLGHRVRYSLRSYRILQDLNRANARNAAILAAIPDTLFRLDTYGRVLSAGAAAARPNAPVVNEFLNKSYPPEIANLICNSMEGARQSGAIHEVEFRLGDDLSQQKYFEARIAAIDAQEALCLVRDITEQKNAEVALRESEALLHQAQTVAHFGSWHLDMKTKTLIWSPEVFRIYHLPSNIPPSYDAILSLVHPADLVQLQEAWDKSLAGKPYEFEHRIIVDDEIRWILARTKFEFDNDGKPIRCLGTIQDITERKVHELLMVSAQNKLQATLDAIPDMMFEIDSDGQYLDYHFPTYKTYEKFPGEIIGNTVASRLPAEATAIFMAALKEAGENGFSNGRQFTVPRGDATVWFELSVARKVDAHADKPRFVVLAREITERKEAEARIHDLAYFDSLTRLPSRFAFVERLDREVQRAAAAGCKLGVLFLDIDGFKNINDTLGHTIGDRALQEVADRLRLGLRPSDMISRGNALSSSPLSLARLGGDEFTVLMLNLQSPEEAMLVAERIKDLLRRPFHLEEHELVVTASIGIAIFPDDGNDGADLLKHADSAMYYAKDEGRDSYQFYCASMTRDAVERMNMDSHLRLALERDEFFLVYQPQYDAARGSIHSVEALIRWHHPQRGLVSPGEFIPRIEANGLIVPIGEWALRTACRDLMSWQQYGRDLRVAVNLSPMQFRNSSLLTTIKSILNETGLPPEKLELEVTEGGLMDCSEANLQTLHALRATGITIALDDFGTGYSSMMYLKRLPLNHIKVDQSFIKGLPRSKDSLAIVRAIISLAKNLDFTVTAEGVENIEQALLLKELDCDKLQGYYFSEPVSANAIPKLLGKRWAIDSMTALPESSAMRNAGKPLLSGWKAREP